MFFSSKIWEMIFYFDHEIINDQCRPSLSKIKYHAWSYKAVYCVVDVENCQACVEQRLSLPNIGQRTTKEQMNTTLLGEFDGFPGRRERLKPIPLNSDPFIPTGSNIRRNFRSWIADHMSKPTKSFGLHAKCFESRNWHRMIINFLTKAVSYVNGYIRQK